MVNNNNGKIVIETKEDKRLEVAIELAKTVNNLSEMLKNMETSISNIHINGCNIQTAQGETALYMGNGVKNSSVTNSIFQTDFNQPTREELAEELFGDDEDWEDEENDNHDAELNELDREEQSDSEEETKIRKLETAFKNISKENEKYKKLVDAFKELVELEME